MALHGSLTSAALMSLFAFLLVITGPYLALGSSRGGPSGLTGNAVIPPSPAGICAAAVAVHGYKCQEFDVRTDDGYILSVQRIPEGRVGGGGKTKKQPVLLQHGVLVDGMSWLLNSPDESLAFILANNGFDVWISNIRGTRFSRRHSTLNANDPEFWNWTWDDLVTHDLPSVIDFVFKQTGQKINYVGHSMGTLIALASFSEGKQVDKVKSAALLSPIAYLSHMTTALGVVAARTFVGEITKLFGLAEFNPKGAPVANLLKALCAQPGVDCYDLMAALTGKNCCLNSSTVELFLKNEPQSTATKNMIHLAQNENACDIDVRSPIQILLFCWKSFYLYADPTFVGWLRISVRDGILSKYDYGNGNYNLEHYGESRPPVYNLTNIPHNLPLFLSYGGQDALSDVRDVQTLLDSLKLHEPDKISIQYVKDFAHADFIMGVTAKDVVFPQVIEFFRHQL